MASFSIIGDEDTIVGYRFAGVPGTAADTPEQALEAFRAAVREHTCQVLLLTAPVADMIREEVLQHRVGAQPPYVVVVGDIWKTPVERPSLVDMINEAVGIRIMTDTEMPE
ncbi:MAG: hypothetical protein GXP31_07450 [Kiritimatiellaeota bacterium]|nr:hypothetical protein [Kiritimatiellota bacterium]